MGLKDLGKFSQKKTISFFGDFPKTSRFEESRGAMNRSIAVMEKQELLLRQHCHHDHYYDHLGFHHFNRKIAKMLVFCNIMSKNREEQLTERKRQLEEKKKANQVFFSQNYSFSLRISRFGLNLRIPKTSCKSK